MTRLTTAFAAALALFMPFGRRLLVGQTPTVGFNAGLLLAKQAAYAQSAEELELIELGLVKIGIRNLEGAVADFTKAIQINPNNEYAYHYRDNARYLLKDY